MNLDGPTLPLARHEDGQHKCPECGATLASSADSRTTKSDCPVCKTPVLILTPERSLATLQAKLGGRFKLIEKLGQGGFGAVWRGFDEQLGREVALKLPLGHLDAAAIERFLHEARSAAGLKHPGIVAVYDVGVQDDQVFIVNELIEGHSLAEHLENHKPGARDAAILCLKICQALHVAHQAGIVHRDLKPSNILIDGNGDPHVADFGLAKSTAAAVTATMDGQVLGTPAYMSPEQASGKSHLAGPAADIYALGVILFELLTGERPFRGSLQAVLKQIVEDDPPAPLSLQPQVPRDLEILCLKCLRKNPTDRFESTSQLADELGRYLDGIPIKSRPVSRFERIGSWCKRNRALATALTLIIVSLTVGTIVSSILGWQARQSSNTASQLAARRKELIGELQQKTTELEQRSTELANEKQAVENQKKIAEDNLILANQRAEQLRRQLYNIGIASAWQQFGRREYALATATLERLVPQENETDLRELLWHHLWSQLHAHEWELDSHDEVAIALPKTGHVITASSGPSHRLGILNTSTGEMGEAIPVESTARLCVAPDGQRLAALDQPNRLQWIDLENNAANRVIELPFEFYHPGDALFSMLEFAGAPAQVLISHYPNDGNAQSVHELSLFDVTSETVDRSWPAADSAFAVRDSRVVYLAPGATSRDAELTVIDLRDENVRFALPITPKKVGPWSNMALKWVSENRFAVIDDTRLQIYIVATEGIRLAREEVMPDKVYDLQWSPGLDRLLVKFSSGNAALVDPYSAEIITYLPGFEQSHIGVDYAIVDYDRSLVASDGKRIRKWLLADLPPDGRSLGSVRSNASGTLGFTLNRSNNLLLWQSLEQDEPVRLEFGRNIYDLALHPSEPIAILVSYYDSSLETYVEVLDLEKGTIERVLDGVPQPAESVEFSADGERFLIVGQRVDHISNSRSSEYPQIRRYPDGELLRELPVNTDSARLTPDGTQVLVSYANPNWADNSLHLYHIATGELVWSTDAVGSRESYSATGFSADGERLLLGKQDGTIEVRRLRTKELVQTFQSNRMIEGLAQADSDHLWLLENDRTIRYLDLIDETELISVSGPAPRDARDKDRLVYDARLSRLAVEPGVWLLGDLTADRLLNRAASVEQPAKRIEFVGLGSEADTGSHAQTVRDLIDQLELIAVSREPATAEQLEQFRKAWHQLRLIRLNDESRRATEQEYAVFLFWWSDFLARFDREHGYEQLRFDESPLLIYERAKLCWSRQSRELEPRRRIMMSGLQNNCARYLMRHGNFGQAIFRLGDAIVRQREVIAEYPDNLQARAFMKNHLSLIVDAHAARNEHEKAFAYCQEMLELDPSDPRLVDTVLEFAGKGISTSRDDSQDDSAELESKLIEKLGEWMTLVQLPFDEIRQLPHFGELENLLGEEATSQLIPNRPKQP